MIIVIYTVKIVYICIFMTCSTSYCLVYTLTDPWNVCMKSCKYAYACDTQGNSSVVTLSTASVLSTVLIYSVLLFQKYCLHFNHLTHLHLVSCV
jgi:hypothetical protein